MHRAGLSKRELAQALSACGDKITEQALGMWWSRGKVPVSRVAGLAQVLDSGTLMDELAKAIVQPSGAVAAPRPKVEPATRYSAQAVPAAALSAQGQMLAEWFDKIEDPIVKLECFHGCTALLIQALRREVPTDAPAPPPL